MAIKTNHEKYRDGLTESIKVVGKMMIDNAEDLAGKMSYMSGFDISISFDPAGGSIPELTVSRSYLPPREEVMRLFDIYKNGNPKYQKKSCGTCLYETTAGCGLNTLIGKVDPNGDCPNWTSRDTYPEKECEIRGE